jgi:hypothetical protein
LPKGAVSTSQAYNNADLYYLTRKNKKLRLLPRKADFAFREKLPIALVNRDFLLMAAIFVPNPAWYIPVLFGLKKSIFKANQGTASSLYGHEAAPQFGRGACGAICLAFC